MKILLNISIIGALLLNYGGQQDIAEILEMTFSHEKIQALIEDTSSPSLTIVSSGFFAPDIDVTGISKTIEIIESDKELRKTETLYVLMDEFKVKNNKASLSFRYGDAFVRMVGKKSEGDWHPRFVKIAKKNTTYLDIDF